MKLGPVLEPILMGLAEGINAMLVPLAGAFEPIMDSLMVFAEAARPVLEIVGEALGKIFEAKYLGKSTNPGSRTPGRGPLVHIRRRRRTNIRSKVSLFQVITPNLVQRRSSSTFLYQIVFY